MTAENKEIIKQKIVDRLEEVQENITNLQDRIQPVAPDVAIGRLTRMDAIQQKQMAESNLRTNESIAIQLRNTLKRIEREDFGVCDICGREMPIERMLAVPEATACVPCLSGK